MADAGRRARARLPARGWRPSSRARRPRAAVEARDLALLPGDRLGSTAAATTSLAVVQEVNARGRAYDRTSNRASWTRFRSDTRTGPARCAPAIPGFDFDSFEMLRRGRSGRVVEDPPARPRRPHRRRRGPGSALDARPPGHLVHRQARHRRAARQPGWLFTGRGWGHGVGMCQVGAYGMALRGHGYQEILQHYYSGVEIARTR